MRLADEKALARLLKETRCRVAGTAATPAAVSPRMKAKAPVGRSELETELQAQIEKSGLPQPSGMDVPYLIGSKHRLDFCWESLKFGIECQGMPHRIKERFKQDIRKRIAGQLQGWLIAEVDGDSIRNGDAIEWIRLLLKSRQ